MRVYRLGSVSWSDSQLFYHALARLARLAREGLISCSPDRPYVCLGFHQDVTQELDLAYCRRMRLPIFQ
ncbi:MAG: hypothetical protein KQI62_13920 [Deltaproteobacteria bacterium]|nr:hypothetical protein [Deltaproteobacteria bacterium]